MALLGSLSLSSKVFFLTNLGFANGGWPSVRAKYVFRGFSCVTPPDPKPMPASPRFCIWFFALWCAIFQMPLVTEATSLLVANSPNSKGNSIARAALLRKAYITATGVYTCISGGRSFLGGKVARSGRNYIYDAGSARAVPGDSSGSSMAVGTSCSCCGSMRTSLRGIAAHFTMKNGPIAGGKDRVIPVPEGVASPQAHPLRQLRTGDLQHLPRRDNIRRYHPSLLVWGGSRSLRRYQ